MANSPRLLDRYGRPVRTADLKREVAGPTLSGVRSPLSGYPADGLTPLKLAAILREADQGDPIRYLELAETIEERDPHYLGVLGTRRRSVSQIDITVEPGTEDARGEEIADRIRDWLARDELAEELFDVLDCIGKGYSFTEILWDTSSGQWDPARLERRDPRWFRFDRAELTTPRLLDEGGEEKPLPGFKFIDARIKAKSGLPLRGGLARVATWGWLFKMYTQRDWAIFTQTYMQPLRLGRWGAGATEEDKSTLFRAVANIAGDCAAIIPESMQIEFVEANGAAATSDVYLSRVDWLDRQISKAVLGQTATTDAIAGGHAVGQEHREVQEDIERADAKALAAILNRDLIRPWVDLEWGPQPRYPRLVIARPEAEDLSALASQLSLLVPLGLKVSAASVRDKFGLEEPDGEDDTLGAAPERSVGDRFEARTAKIKAVEGSGRPPAGDDAAPQAEGTSEGRSGAFSVPGVLAGRMAVEAAPAMGAIMARIEAMLAAATGLEEFREMLLAGFPDLDASALVETMARGLTVAQAAGRIDVEEESDV